MKGTSILTCPAERPSSPTHKKRESKFKTISSTITLHYTSLPPPYNDMSFVSIPITPPFTSLFKPHHPSFFHPYKPTNTHIKPFLSLSSHTHTHIIIFLTMSTLVFITLVLLLFLSTPTVMLAARSSPFKAAPPVAKPARAKSHGYTTLRPRWSKKRHAFRGREIGNCLPKGFRPPPSAPSRYANYQPLGGSNACSSKPQTKP